MRALVALVALLVLALAFAALTPATLVDARIAATTAGQVRLAAAEGTVWSGHGLLWGPGGAWQLPVAWRLDPLDLLRGGLRVQLVPAGDASARGVVQVREDAVNAENLHVALPAAALTSAWTGAPAPQLAGTVTVDAPTLHADRTRVDGSFRARWTTARVVYAGVLLDLGNVEANGQPQGGALDIALHGEGGDVGIDGHARVEGNVASVDATLVPAPTLPPAMALLLRALGPATADGGVRVTWRQAWR